MPGRRWGVIGFGEVGSTFARHLSDRTEEPVMVADPVLAEEPLSPRTRERLEGTRVRVAGGIEELVSGADVVLSTVTVGVADEVALAAAESWCRGLFVDLNSTEPGAKQRAAGAFPDGAYVDGAILGAIRGEGASTPLALAGPRSAEALEALSSAGFQVSVTGSKVGAASALKLCRSVFMKGLECLFAETLLAAREYDLEAPVLKTIEQTVEAYGVTPMADMLVTTHASHCGRRAREMDGAVRMLEEMGLPATMSRASRNFLDASCETGLVDHFSREAPGRLDEVLEFLDHHYRKGGS